MSPPSSTSSSRSYREISVRQQILIGLSLIALVFWLGLKASIYVSAWDEEDSNFFENATDGLRVMSIQPSGPILVLFWDKDCQDCLSNFEYLQESPLNVRVYGIHLTASASEQGELQQLWAQAAPPHAQLVVDQQDLLTTAFRVRGVPASYILFPKENRVYSHVGLLRRSQRQMLKILKRN